MKNTIRSKKSNMYLIFAVFASVLMCMTTAVARPVQENANINLNSSLNEKINSFKDILENANTAAEGLGIGILFCIILCIICPPAYILGIIITLIHFIYVCFFVYFDFFAFLCLAPLSLIWPVYWLYVGSFA